MAKVKETTISGIRQNIMGTTSFDLQVPNMRKPQKFTVYPIAKNDPAQEILIQSETRVGKINLKTGLLQISKSFPNGAYIAMLAVIRLESFNIKAVDAQALRMHIFTTADSEAGNSVVTTDNSGAKNVLD